MLTVKLSKKNAVRLNRAEMMSARILLFFASGQKKKRKPDRRTRCEAWCRSKASEYFYRSISFALCFQKTKKTTLLKSFIVVGHLSLPNEIGKSLLIKTRRQPKNNVDDNCIKACERDQEEWEVKWLEQEKRKQFLLSTWILLLPLVVADDENNSFILLFRFFVHIHWLQFFHLIVSFLPLQFVVLTLRQQFTLSSFDKFYFNSQFVCLVLLSS